MSYTLSYTFHKYTKIHTSFLRRVEPWHNAQQQNHILDVPNDSQEQFPSCRKINGIIYNISAT
jgi:hypothetical protein